MIPLKIRAIIHLDAFAAISSTPNILLETATQRCHRPNRNLWAEIEYTLKLRIQTGAWQIPDMDKLRDQLENAERDLETYKKATPSERKTYEDPK